MKRILSLFLALSLLLIMAPTAMAASLEVRADMALSYGGGKYIDQSEALTAYCQNTGLSNFSYGYIVTYTGGFGGGGADASLPVENAEKVLIRNYVSYDKQGIAQITDYRVVEYQCKEGK